MPTTRKPCDHNTLSFSASSHASVVGYKQPPSRFAATSALTSRRKEADPGDLSTFPAPLVLPEDELAWDPKYPPQTLRDWLRLKERNKVTPERRTVYFVGPPDIGPGLEHIKEWTQPRLKYVVPEEAVEFPKTREVLDYLEAHYLGLPVKLLPSPLCFTADGDAASASVQSKGKKKKSKKPKSETLWLNAEAPAGAIGINTRPTPNGSFSHQLNLNDLLDAAIDILPADAYALLMLVEHDIFEDEEDDFACGRAYGGSRIAVVSGARYNPMLDEDQYVEREHSWPASHCESYIQECCEAAEEDDEEPKKKKPKIVKVTSAKSIFAKEKETSPMYAALTAHTALPSMDRKPSVKALYGLWLGRTVRTAGHELGHCFGIDHCTYYACSMQGTASIIEDARQPPYLCPVDLAKVLRATEVSADERDGAILKYCEKYPDAHLFAAYAAWIRKKLDNGGGDPKTV